jgi:putative phosphoesterase
MVDGKLRKLFRRASALVHAGDLADEATLAALKTLVPGVPALFVRGNNDRGAFAAALPRVAAIDVQGVRILAAHTREAAAEALAGEPRARVVVYGHSHKPLLEVREGRMWLNPGGAGPKRFSLPRAAALLELGRVELVARVFSLEDDAMPALGEARLTVEP